MIIFANLQSNLSVSFWGKDFPSINMHYNWKNDPTPTGTSSIDGESLATLVKGHQMIIYANLQSNLFISFWDDFQRTNIHYNRKTAPPPCLIYWQRKFVLATLVEDHKKIIHSNLQSNLFISFRREDFQRINTHYNWKNSPTPIEASIFDQSGLFWQLW